jgi:hypothetical protein
MIRELFIRNRSLSFPCSLVDLPESETPDQVVLLGCRELTDGRSGEVWKRIEVLFVE